LEKQIMKSKLMRSTCYLTLAMILASCAGPSIGLNTEFKQANFQVKKTTKQEIIDYLGLPQMIMKDSEGREHYIYEGSTRLTGLCIGCGTVNGGVGAIPALINQSGVKNGAEYVIDKDNLLVAKFEPTKD
jgi:hypothetical protein